MHLACLPASGGVIVSCILFTFMPDTTEQPAPLKDSPTDILHFEKWLAILGERQATDLHLAVGNVPMLRLDGAITPLLEEDILTAERLNTIVRHLLAEDELKILESEREVIVSQTLKKVMRFRIHVFYSRSFLSLSMRYLPAEEPNLEALGLPDLIKECRTAERGLLFITGPFDSGRTTTVRALLSAINQTRADYIVTLEKPIEYLIPSVKSVVVQRAIGRDAKDFASALTALNEEDANVIVISKLDTQETVEQALTLAASGRLIIAVGDSRHALGLIEQLRDLFPESQRSRVLSLLADSLIGIVAQLLLPRLGGGRILISEVLRGTNPVKSLIRDNKLVQLRTIMQTARAEGMFTLDQSLAQAVKSGSVALATAKEQAIDQNQFNSLVSH